VEDFERLARELRLTVNSYVVDEGENMLVLGPNPRHSAWSSQPSFWGNRSQAGEPTGRVIAFAKHQLAQEHAYLEQGADRLGVRCTPIPIACESLFFLEPCRVIFC
jgi:hypothetical protein